MWPSQARDWRKGIHNEIMKRLHNIYCWLLNAIRHDSSASALGAPRPEIICKQIYLKITYSQGGGKSNESWQKSLKMTFCVNICDSITNLPVGNIFCRTVGRWISFSTRSRRWYTISIARSLYWSFESSNSAFSFHSRIANTRFHTLRFCRMMIRRRKLQTNCLHWRFFIGRFKRESAQYGQRIAKFKDGFAKHVNLFCTDFFIKTKL